MTEPKLWSVFGRMLSKAELAELANIPLRTMRHRLAIGMSPDAAVSTPLRKDKTKIGDVFGRLTVVSVAGDGKRGPLLRCRCECGKMTTVERYHLKSGNTRSCGCLHIEAIGATRDLMKERYANHDVNGERLSINRMSQQTGLTRDTIRRRMGRGLSPTEAASAARRSERLYLVFGQSMSTKDLGALLNVSETSVRRMLGGHNAGNELDRSVLAYRSRGKSTPPAAE